jgi:hypothetical protein
MLITIISCDYLNLSLENEYVGDVTIPTQVIEYNQNFLQADQVIRLQYSNQIELYIQCIYTYIFEQECFVWWILCYLVFSLTCWQPRHKRIGLIKYREYNGKTYMMLICIKSRNHHVEYLIFKQYVKRWGGLSSWLWLYGSWNNIYLCNQCLSPQNLTFCF